MQRALTRIFYSLLCMLVCLCITKGFYAQSVQTNHDADTAAEFTLYQLTSAHSTMSVASYPISEHFTRAEESALEGVLAGLRLPVFRLNPWARMYDGACDKTPARRHVPDVHVKVQASHVGEYVAQIRKEGYYVYSLRKIII